MTSTTTSRIAESVQDAWDYMRHQDEGDRSSRCDETYEECRERVERALDEDLDRALGADARCA